ncbi:cellulose-growth-specific protein [Plectosphaerella cucumerina]|uniref:lytic cellulose monooxygenase (C4-dehydrogenating) n=1 Tax=Plectosphaerella cucumerina TaxID=40658 RepID=A0A8K0TQQ3_9PEZI|nr:cellulose-growth-specific protein [Plectosphaerella cucumerina]
MKQALLALVAAAGVSAHYNFEALIVNGQVTAPYQYVRSTTNSNSPIEDVTSNSMVCNQGGQDAAIRAATGTKTVQAGDQLGFDVNSDLGHPGPLAVYLSKAPAGVSAQNYLGDGEWFKIYAATVREIIPNYGVDWAVFPNSRGVHNFTFTLPAQTPPGEYLLRAEHIGIHAAGSVGGAQFYIGCAQIKVEGGNPSANPGPKVKIPGYVSARDPAIYFNPYWPPLTSYNAPGPVTWPNACEDATANLWGQPSDGDCTPRF